MAKSVSFHYELRLSYKLTPIIDSMEKLSFGFLTGVINSILCACVLFGDVAGDTFVEVGADAIDKGLTCHNGNGVKCASAH